MLVLSTMLGSVRFYVADDGTITLRASKAKSFPTIDAARDERDRRKAEPALSAIVFEVGEVSFAPNPLRN